MADVTNPGSTIQYNASNPFNVGVSGTGNFSGSEMNSAQGVTANGGFINSSVLAPATPIQYTTATPTPIPSISSLETQSSPQLTETPEEQQASNLGSTLQGLNNSMVGKAAYQAQQNTAAGVDSLTQQQNDLSTQLSQLKNEALAIPQQLQLDATGRGITSGGLAPISTAALRNNSIQALGISSMLDASKGLLATAQAKADKAVAAKYDPIQEQIDAATANLKLILNDPQTSVDDKNRAQAQLDAQNAKSAQLATAKQNAADVLAASINAAKNGADAATLQKMQAATDGTSALKIAAEAGYGNSSVLDLMTKYPDAKIQQGDSIAQANMKVQQSPSFTQAQKTAALDIALKQSEIDKNNATITGTGTGTTTGSIANDVQAVLEGRNTMYNIRQTMGRTNAAAAYMQAMRNAITKVDPNFDFVASDAGGKSVSTQYVQKATAAINSVLPNINKVVDLSNQVSRIGVTGVDKFLQSGSVIINNQKVSNFHEAQKLISDEIGVALGAGTVSDMKLQLGFDVTDPSVSQEVFASNMGIVKDFIQNRLSGLQSLRYKSSTAGGTYLSQFENGGTDNSGSTSNGVDLTKFHR